MTLFAYTKFCKNLSLKVQKRERAKDSWFISPDCDQEDHLCSLSRLRWCISKIISLQSSHTYNIHRPPFAEEQLKIFNKGVKCSIRMVDDVNIFRHKFNELTTHLFDNFNWDGVFIAGGIVCCALLESACNLVDPVWAQRSDIDVFLYNMTEAEAKTKIYSLYKLWTRTIPQQKPSDRVVPHNSIVWRTRHTLTFACDERRPLQVRGLRVITHSCGYPGADSASLLLGDSASAQDSC